MGLLTAVLLFGTVGVCVGETVAELVQLFPVPNAIFEYVYTFVDHGLAWAVGALYWFTYASIVPYQIVGASKLLSFWMPMSNVAVPRIFAALCPFVLLSINLADVTLFGWIEAVSGGIKLALILVISVLLYVVADKDFSTGPSSLSSLWNFESNQEVVDNPVAAFCYALPLVAFSYIGIEAFAMAAFEARKTETVRLWSQLTHWTVLLVYFLCTLGIILTVPWEHGALPLPYDPRGPASQGCKNKTTSSAVIIGVSSGKSAFGEWDPCEFLNPPIAVASAVNGILLFSTLSAANASLYVASRTLYGLTYQGAGGGTIRRWLQRNTGVVWPKTGAPAMALFISLMAWYAIIFLHIAKANGNKGVSNFLRIISVSQSISAIIVWASICLAYVRFQRWTYKCQEFLVEYSREKFLRTSRHYKSHTLLSWLQPLAAYYVILMCLSIFVFTSSSMWKEGADLTSFMAAYLPHIFLFFVVAGRKLYYRKSRSQGESAQGWVSLSTDRGGSKLIGKLVDLENLSASAADRHLDHEQVPAPSQAPSWAQDHRMDYRNGGDDEDHGHCCGGGLDSDFHFGGSPVVPVEMRDMEPREFGGSPQQTGGGRH